MAARSSNVFLRGMFTVYKGNFTLRDFSMQDSETDARLARRQIPVQFSSQMEANPNGF